MHVRLRHMRLTCVEISIHTHILYIRSRVVRERNVHTPDGDDDNERSKCNGNVNYDTDETDRQCSVDNDGVRNAIISK